MTSSLESPGLLHDDDLRLYLRGVQAGNHSMGHPPTYRFDMRVDGTRVGTIILRVGHEDAIELYAGHIGYEVNARYRGRRYAARSCALLLPIAKRLGLNPLWITCNPDNYASRRTCEIIGARLVEIVDLPPTNDMYLHGERQKCRYRIDL